MDKLDNAENPPPNAIAVFLDEARWQADWQWRRAQNFEGKASQLLAFAGIVLGLLGTLVAPLRELPLGYRILGVVLLGVTASLLVATGRKALSALGTREVSGPPRDSVRGDWQRARGQGQEPDDVRSRLASALLAGTDAKPAVVESLACDADQRGAQIRLAGRLLVYGMLGVALLLVLIAAVPR